MSSEGYQDAQNTQRTEYQLTPRLKKEECPDIWMRLPRHKWPTSRYNIEKPAVPLDRNLCGRPLVGSLWERHFERVLLENGWGESTKLGMLVCASSARSFLSVYVDDIKLVGKKQNIDPMWMKLMKHGDLEELTSFLDCTQNTSSRAHFSQSCQSS